jgi:hypothetical protein
VAEKEGNDMTADIPRLCEAARAAVPKLPPDPIEHAEVTVQLPGSARSRHFRCSITPWIREIIIRAVRCLNTRIVTFVKPVQSGGSVAGEVIILDRIQFGFGFLQYNWADNEKAKNRWESRIEKVLKACAPVKAKIDALPRFEAVKCEVDFGNVFFRMQGAFDPGNLDSDSVACQVNEEVHAWEPGHLQKARNRATAVVLPKSVDISNAGKKGDQLHQALEDGTHQHWLVKCPGCGQMHRMRTRWEDKRPDLGGLRYDSKECRREGGGFDYNKLKGTIRFQMPCGYIVHDDPMERRALSLSGDYSQPTNTGADGTHRSYTLEAVSVDYISWLKLIKEKHDALRARRLGDLEPWRRYLTERECQFFDPDDVPIAGSITLSTEVKKNREGLPYPMRFNEKGELANPDGKLRPFALDRQQGSLQKGESPHWWLVIRDVVIVDGELKSQLVFEGKCETDEQAIARLDEHGCVRCHGVADSGDDTPHVYAFCLKYGINAIKGGGEQWYNHDGHRRIFSPERPLHLMIPGRTPMHPYVMGADGSDVPDVREPLFWLYSKTGIREQLNYLRTETKWIVPDDVSEDYQSHMEAEERTSRKHSRTGEVIHEWVQLKSRNDLFVCECYIAMLIQQAGFVREPETTEKK